MTLYIITDRPVFSAFICSIVSYVLRRWSKHFCLLKQLFSRISASYKLINRIKNQSLLYSFDAYIFIELIFNLLPLNEECFLTGGFPSLLFKEYSWLENDLLLTDYSLKVIFYTKNVLLCIVCDWIQQHTRCCVRICREWFCGRGESTRCVKSTLDGDLLLYECFYHIELKIVVGLCTCVLTCL